MQQLKRWMYRDNRPNWLAQWLNRAWRAYHSSGISKTWVTLEVIGRKSGKIISFPVVLAMIDSNRYVVSMLGDDAQWVKNVRAADGKAFIKSGKRTEVRLETVSIEARAPILKDYLRRAPGARPHFPISKDAPLADFEAIAADFPAYRIMPTQL